MIFSESSTSKDLPISKPRPAKDLIPNPMTAASQRKRPAEENDEVKEGPTGKGGRFGFSAKELPISEPLPAQDPISNPLISAAQRKRSSDKTNDAEEEISKKKGQKLKPRSRSTHKN